jgi:hypothetical protein
MDDKLPVGLNHKDLAAYLNISQDRFYEFKNTNSEFSEALDFYSGRSTVEVLKSFKKAACGFEFTETKSKLQKDKEGGKYKMQVVEEVKKFVPPNATAAFQYLKNKMGHHFKDKQETELSFGGALENVTFVIKGKG